MPSAAGSGGPPPRAVAGVLDGQTGRFNPGQREFLEYVLQSGRRLFALIKGLLDVARVEAGKLELELSDVVLADILESSLERFRSQAAEKNQGLELDMKAGLPERIRGDVRKLSQIIDCLLSNALKFTPEQGEISLRSAAAGPRAGVEWISISVSDSGIGLEEEDLTRIFGTF